MQKQNSNDKKIILALIVMLFLLSKHSLIYNPELNNIVCDSLIFNHFTLTIWSEGEVKLKIFSILQQYLDLTRSTS